VSAPAWNHGSGLVIEIIKAVSNVVSVTLAIPSALPADALTAPPYEVRPLGWSATTDRVSAF